jgi:hypothetical protein
MKEWSKITSRIRKHIDFRNHLAHNPAAYLPEEPYTLGELLQGKPKRIRANPHVIGTSKSKMLAKKDAIALGFEEISEHIATVTGIIKDMERILGQLPRYARKRRAKSPRPKASPKSGSTKQSRPIPGARKRPPGSSRE